MAGSFLTHLQATQLYLATEAELAAVDTHTTAKLSKAKITEAIQRNYILLSSSRISVPGAM